MSTFFSDNCSTDIFHRALEKEDLSASCQPYRNLVSGVVALSKPVWLIFFKEYGRVFTPPHTHTFSRNEFTDTQKKNEGNSPVGSVVQIKKKNDWWV